MNQFNLLKNKSARNFFWTGIFTIFILSIFVLSFVLADDWPMFMHDSNHTGYSSDTINLTNFGVVWKDRHFNNILYDSSPSI